MSIIEKVNILQGYENAQLKTYNDFPVNSEKTFLFSELETKSEGGIPLIIQRKDNVLYETFTDDTHALIIGATRSGKTTSYIIPTIFSKASQKRKDNMLITDPKGELYAQCSNMLREKGYKIILLNLRDYHHSECWNPLTPIFRKYQLAFHLEDKIEVVKKGNHCYHVFNNKEFTSILELERELEFEKEVIITDVGNDIDAIAASVVTITSSDQYWDASARELFKAFLWGMLEDSIPNDRTDALITEDNYSFRTICSIMAAFTYARKVDDGDNGYFTKRPITSKALEFAKNSIIANADTTRMCIISSFNAKLAPFRESIASQITSCNTFELDELASSDKPVAVFVCYRDESKVSYVVIQQFISAAYNKLIEIANNSDKFQLKKPFYFILDEFGNFPRINDFENTISACGSRNIWFVIVLQSYAQLYNVYREDISEIIKDNLNMHIFLGTNNPNTKKAFSIECGYKTIISPKSALNGKGIRLNHFEIDTIPLIPISDLNHFEIGECMITRANAQEVLKSKFERSYLCPEFQGTYADVKDYSTKINIYDEKYFYCTSGKNTRFKDDDWF